MKFFFLDQVGFVGVQLCLAGGRSEGNMDYEFYELNVCVCLYVCMFVSVMCA